MSLLAPNSIAPGSYVFSDLNCIIDGKAVDAVCTAACFPKAIVAVAAGIINISFSRQENAPNFPPTANITGKCVMGQTVNSCSSLFTLPDSAVSLNTTDFKVYKGMRGFVAYAQGGGFSGKASFDNPLDSTKPLTCAFVADLAGYVAPVPSNATCEVNSYRCNGLGGFSQCDNGIWKNQSCALGSYCIQATLYNGCTGLVGRGPSGNSCKFGDYKCSGSGSFLQCSNGYWVRQSCAAGTVCDDAKIKTLGCVGASGNGTTYGNNYGSNFISPNTRISCNSTTAASDFKCHGANSYYRCNAASSRWNYTTCAEGSYCTSDTISEYGCATPGNYQEPFDQCYGESYRCNSASSYSKCGSDSGWTKSTCSSGYTCNDNWIGAKGCTDDMGDRKSVV